MNDIMSIRLKFIPSMLAPAQNAVVKGASRRICGTIRLPVRVNQPSEGKLPHERDESVSMTGGIPSVTMKQAYRDVSQRLQDTDRGPEAERAYKKLKR